MDTSGEEVDVINGDVPESISSSGDIMQEMVNVAKILTRVNMGTACSSERSANLNMLMMYVATKESEYEASISDEELVLKDSAEKVLYLDLLCGILDSEVNELKNFMSKLRIEIVVARTFMVSYKDLGEDSEDVEKMLKDCEESLRQSLDQISDIKEQSSGVQRNILRSSGENTWKGSKAIEQVVDENLSDPRITLNMLERSLARELDLDKQIAESREVEEDLKLRLHFSEHENLCLEEEDLVLLERLFEGENIAEVLMGISKELLCQIQKLIFNRNVSKTRENNLRSKLEDSIQELKAKDATLQRTESSNTKINEVLLAEKNNLIGNLIETEDRLILVDSEAFTLRETVSSLETQLKEHERQMMDLKTPGDEGQNLLQKLQGMSNTQDDLKKQLCTVEARAETAEAKCKLLTESNKELNEELNIHRASAEASQEKENMLKSTIKDMENVIQTLKSKVLKAENQVETTEDKCIELSECNSDLTDKLHFLKCKMDCLKVSLHQAEESKKATAKDIRTQTKLITEMVMQLAFERERLQKQISSLTKQNKIPVDQSQKTSKSQVNSSHNMKEDTKILTSSVTMRNSKSADIERKDEIDGGPDDCRLDLETVRNIDARQLNVKYVIMMVLVLVISVFAALLFQPPDSGF
ncbi:WPP domain-interacting tail-anchored protein 2 [Heracleum sosnowskyi]|uniref:WPP domain-interacting tail-anchored protein 2 n=1 Tax=Heracleum sosnowskyi TaxID=360622 RepID=A0AAD8MKK1_9APIA|nr:WPP domain-interacting tail-anchored protein 2 [Heracleum sosnowskyi]